MISALVEGHYESLKNEPTPERIAFGLAETRTADRLVDLVARFPAEAAKMQLKRSVLTHAFSGDLPTLRAELDAEVRAEQEKDRIYWEPLKREMEAFRREERGNA